MHEVRLFTKIVADLLQNLAPLQVLDEDFALVRPPRRQYHVHLDIDVNCVVEAAQHDGATLRASEVGELVADALVLDEFLVVKRRQRHVFQLFLHKRMRAQLLHRHSVFLDRLEAFEEEEAGLDGDFLVLRLAGHPVATVVNLSNQLLHVCAIERGRAEDHLVQDDAERPRVHCLVVLLAAQDLRALIQRSPDD